MIGISKIRNLKYRYLQEGSLLPEEVDTYDPYVIREALNNCIAHPDYSLGGKINVIENGSLIFTNAGLFLPLTIENVISADAPSAFYRNNFLSDAMVNLSMIDTIGSGIRSMFISQKNKYFPLPDYDLTKNEVKVAVVGKILDVSYARKLAQIPDLDLNTIVLLDKVQKRQPITADETKLLRSKSLIEGKRPNIYISSKVATTTNQRSDYMKLKGVDDAFCKNQIMAYLEKYKSGTKQDFNNMLVEKLPDILTKSQKENKVKNILQSLKREGIIEVAPKKAWVLVRRTLDEL